MKIQKQVLSFETDYAEVVVGLISLEKKIPDYEFFFHLNKKNNLQFARTEDLIIDGRIYTYQFPQYEAYHEDTKSYLKIIANKSSESVQKILITELFTDEESYRFLLQKKNKTDYIIWGSDGFRVFPLLLPPENINFEIQEHQLNSNEELYQIIQYYE